MNYYSKRNKDKINEITEDFFVAFNAYIDELKEENFDDNVLVNSFGDFENSYGYYVSEYKINNKMAQELGYKKYPFHKKEKVDITMQKTETILELIEFFYKFISDKGKNIDIRYKYTVRINEFFNNFNLLYKLKNGVVITKHSVLMDEAINKDDINIIGDEKVSELIKEALNKFYKRDFKEQKIGLEKIVDAFQRISSWEDKNKLKSVDKILNKVTNSGLEKELLEKDLLELWGIANNFMIRHSEVNRKDINDVDFLEYLFYQYYNSIRFILKKYKYLQ